MFASRLMIASLVVAISAAAGAQTIPVAQESAAAAPVSAMAQEYTSSISIFARNRQPATGAIREAVSTQAAVKSVRAPFFVGAMKDEIGVAGILEMVDEQGVGTSLKIHVGDRIPWENVRVESISLDSLLIATESGMREIPLGADLNRQPQPAVSTPVTRPAGAVPVGAGPQMRFDPSNPRIPRPGRNPSIDQSQQRQRQRPVDQQSAE